MITQRHLVTVGLSFCALSANATVIVSTGQSLDISNQVTEPISIEDGGHVTVRNGGEIIAPRQAVQGTGTVTVRGNAQRSVFEIEGNGSLTSTQGVALMVRQQSTTRLSDDARIVANGSNPAIGSFTANRLNADVYLEDRATVVGNVTMDGTIHLADQAHITGRLSQQDGSVALIMSGGAIDGGVNLRNAGDYSANITGGRIDNGFEFGPSSVATFTMNGGEIHGGFTSHGSLTNSSILGGSIFGGLNLNEFSPLAIWGGSFEATAGDWLIDLFNDVPFSTGSRSILSIYGGQFGYIEDGNGIHLSGIGGLDVYGYDLAFVNGVLSGYLSDGNWLSLSVVTDANWTGAINLHDVRTSVPEPSTALLLLTAMGGMFGARRLTARRAA